MLRKTKITLFDDSYIQLYKYLILARLFSNTSSHNKIDTNKQHTHTNKTMNSSQVGNNEIFHFITSLCTETNEDKSFNHIKYVSRKRSKKKKLVNGKFFYIEVDLMMSLNAIHK